MKSALVILAPGFEETEAIAIIDILRRAQVAVTVAGLEEKFVIGSHKIKIEVDYLLTEAQNQTYDIIILPGGEPGTTNLENSILVQKLIIKQAEVNGYLAAICSAPRIFDKLGLLRNKKATSFPGVKLNNCIYSEDRVVIDEKFITSRTASTAIEFSLAILDVLELSQYADMLRTALLVK